MSELDDLRAQIRDLQRRANKKVSRLKTQKGVYIGGTEFDPRKSLNTVDKLNSIALKAQVKRLVQFNSRSNDYVAGYNGAPIQGKTARAYKAAEKAFNQKGDAYRESVADIHDPTTNQTIGERNANLPERGKRAHKDATEGLYPKTVRDPKYIKGEKAMQAFLKRMNKNLRGDYVESQVKEYRKRINKMLDEIGSADLRKAYNKLNDYQLNLIWNESKIAKAISSMYLQAQSAATKREKRWYDTVFDEYQNDAKDVLEWAQHIETPNRKGATRTNERSSRTPRTQKKS